MSVAFLSIKVQDVVACTPMFGQNRLERFDGLARHFARLAATPGIHSEGSSRGPNEAASDLRLARGIVQGPVQELIGDCG